MTITVVLTNGDKNAERSSARHRTDANGADAISTTAQTRIAFNIQFHLGVACLREYFRHSLRESDRGKGVDSREKSVDGASTPPRNKLSADTPNSAARGRSKVMSG